MWIRSWAGGLTLFGFFYAVIIVAMSVSDWPSLAVPNINVTFEAKLPDEARQFVHLIQKSKRIDVSDDAPSYRLVQNGYTPQESPLALLDTAQMVNGHMIVFEAGVTIENMDAVATQYAEILLEHQIRETANAIVRLFITLFIPIVTLGLFAWAGNSLWRAIQNLD